MKKILIRMCLLAVQTVMTYFAFAQTGQVTNRNILDPSTIPDALRKDANSVIRRFENSFELINPGKGFYKEARTITILNKAGNDDLQFVFFVDKFRTIEEFKAKLYDANGKLIAKYDKKDLRTSASSGAFVDDDKILYLTLSAASYPVTVESESVEKYVGLLNPPEFRFQGFQQGVENAVVKISFPSDINLEFKSFNLNEKPTVTQAGKTKSYEWKFNNLNPIYYETSSWSWKYNVPRIIFHSDKFEMDDFPGNLSTWKDLGIWYNNVIADRNKLSEANKNAIRKLVEGVSDNREKVRIIYKYLQDNFRYVNIALGIGGWRPFPADFVHEKKYGDCKGLSNYMQACLSAVNIKAHW